MIFGPLSFLANHLWQSTLFAGLVLVLSLMLRNNRAHLRYAVWLAASVKFLIPFSLLVAAGTQMAWRTTAPVSPPISDAVQQISRPFDVAEAAEPAVRQSRFPLGSVLFAVWLSGCSVVLSIWAVRWRRVRAAVQSAIPMDLAAPIPVMSTSTLLEPGVFGILRPVLLLPHGIAQRLTEGQLQAILAHELCHVRRRDNLAAAFHMAVEVLFWFHPLVWWIGTRLIEERERACDEDVLQQGNEPQEYAQGILNVCKFYLESPLLCTSGVTGADLKRRIESILSSRVAHRLTFAKKALLGATSAAIVAGPVAIGALGGAQIAVEAAISDKAELKFDVISIHRSDPNARNVRIGPAPGGLRLSNVDLRAMVMFAYGVRPFQITGVPAWAEKERFDVVAKVDNASNAIDMKEAGDRDRDALINDLKERTRSLLVERFQLALHREPKEGPVYNLIVAKEGPKMTASAQQDSGSQHIRMSHGQVNAERVPLQMLIGALSDILGRPIVDRTRLIGNYDFSLKWTPDPEQLARLGPGGPPGPEPPSVPLDAAGPTIFTALEEQLGLRLESAKGRVPVIVIDRAEKPSEN